MPRGRDKRSPKPRTVRPIPASMRCSISHVPTHPPVATGAVVIVVREPIAFVFPLPLTVALVFGVLVGR